MRGVRVEAVYEDGIDFDVDDLHQILTNSKLRNLLPVHGHQKARLADNPAIVLRWAPSLHGDNRMPQTYEDYFHYLTWYKSHLSRLANEGISILPHNTYITQTGPSIAVYTALPWVASARPAKIQIFETIREATPQRQVALAKVGAALVRYYGSLLEKPLEHYVGIYDLDAPRQYHTEDGAPVLLDYDPFHLEGHAEIDQSLRNVASWAGCLAVPEAASFQATAHRIDRTPAREVRHLQLSLA